MSNKSKYILQSILDRINRSDKALERALVILCDNATKIQLHSFRHRIAVYAHRIKNGARLEPHQIAYARMKLAQVKYYGILRRCADQIMQGE